MDGTAIFDLPTLGGPFNPFNVKKNSLNICKTLRKYFFRPDKGMRMVNFYIFNVLGQNLANSESCPILRLLQEAKICTFR